MADLPRAARRARSAVAGAIALLLAAAILAGAVEVGVGLPTRRALGVLPSVGRSTPGYDAASISPLRREFIRELLGAETYERLFGAPGAGDSDSGGDGETASPGRAGGGAPASPSEPPPVSLGPGRLSPVVAPGDWNLTAVTTADRPTVGRGEIVTYRFVVRNEGGGDFSGELTLEWHVPFGTTTADTAQCSVGGDDVEVCEQLPPAPFPGQPLEEPHQGQFQTSETISVGETLVIEARVRVNETTTPGTTLRNHAHMDVLADAVPGVTTNEVVVRVQ